MLKSIISILAILIISFSCTEVVFESAQPKGVEELKKIPESLIGNYSFVVLNKQQNINITENYFEGDDGKKFLSDSLVIKKFDNKYIVNQLIKKEGETNGKWSVFIFEEKGCGFIKATAFIISKDEDAATFTESYAAIPVGSGQEKQLIIDPTKEQFKKLNNDKGAMLSIILEKIN